MKTPKILIVAILLLVGCQAQATPLPKETTSPTQMLGPTSTEPKFVTASPASDPETEPVSTQITPPPTEEIYYPPRPTPIPYTPEPTSQPPDFDQLEVINRTNLNRLTQIWRFEPPGRSEFELSPDGKTMALNEGTYVDLWDLRTGQVVQSLNPSLLGINIQYIIWMVFSADGHKLALLTDGGFLVWDVISAELIGRQVDFPDAGELKTNFMFSPDGKLLVTTGIQYGCDTRIWSAQSGKLLKELENGNQLDAEFSPDGSLLYILSRDMMSIEVWDTNSWYKLYTQTITPETAEFELSSNGEIGLFSSYGMRSRDYLEKSILYSMKDWKQLGIIQDRNPADFMGISGLPFATLPQLNKDGGIIMYSPAINEDGEGSTQIQFWDTLTQQRLLLFETNLPFPIKYTLFSPDGRLLTASMANGTIFFYGVPSKNP